MEKHEDNTDLNSKNEKEAEEQTQSLDESDSDAMLERGSVAIGRSDFNEAILWWTRAANLGNAKAMYNLGSVYYRLGQMYYEEEEGYTEVALYWWTEAADRGIAYAMNQLALHAKNHGDLDQALHWWTQAAESDYPVGMHNLGNLMIEQGDIDRAIHWYLRAAQHGYPNAMRALALHCTLPEAEAREWAKKAREAGLDCPDPESPSNNESSAR